MIDVAEGHEPAFLAIARELSALMARKEYGRADIVRDESSALRFYAVRQWANLGALVHGLHIGDFGVIARALEDTIAEPRRGEPASGQSRGSASSPVSDRDSGTIRRVSSA